MMSKKKKGAGRPVVIEEQTIVATYNVTEKQKDWLKKQGETLGRKASDVLREILKREMEKKGTAS